MIEVQTLWDGKSDQSSQIRDKFEQKFNYNAAGEMIGRVAPRGLQLFFSYNQRSLVTQIDGGFSLDIKSIFSNIDYDYRGIVNQTDMNNGLRICTTRNPRKGFL